MASKKHTIPPTQLELTLSGLETWRPVVGWEAYYEVSSAGRVRSLGRIVPCNLLSTKERLYPARIMSIHDRRRYFRVTLSQGGRKTFAQVHALVLEAFRGQRPLGFVANHIDGNSHNNDIRNLEWVTHKQNIRHKEVTGTVMYGEKNPAARLTAQQVQDMRSLAAAGVSLTCLARTYGISKTTAGRIISRRNWRHIP